MKGFIEVQTTENYPHKILINIKSISAVINIKMEFKLAIGQITTNSIIQTHISCDNYFCVETYEEIKNKIEEAEDGDKN